MNLTEFLTANEPPSGWTDEATARRDFRIAMALQYLANVDHNPAARGEPPTAETVRELVAAGLAVVLGAPYPHAPSHAHLTPEGRALLAQYTLTSSPRAPR